MPRKPRRSGQLVPRPFAFSPFAPNRCSRKHNLKENSSESLSSEEEAPEILPFLDPKPDDFHGLKMLLQSYLNDKDNKCITEIRDYLLKVCEEKNVVGELKRLLEDQADHVGLVVSQRVMNLPPQLLPHLYNALFDEILWATEDEPTKDLRESFRFKHYILVTRIYKQKIGQKRKGSSSSNNEDFIYVKPEDELFFEVFVYPSFVRGRLLSPCSFSLQQAKRLV
uniref:Protein BCCIP homolog n=1 Tax=Chenopodium quinoa TaxID=63459 RepID=A0A803LS86_CHEQI